MKTTKALKWKPREEALRTMKLDVKNMCKKKDIYGDPKDEDTLLCSGKLESLVFQID